MTDSAELWSDPTFTHRLTELTWMTALPVLLHLNERATGHPARDWLTAWAPRFMPGERVNALVLGCGEGWLERALAQHSWIEHIDACDVAADAVARAKALAPPKISYRVLDLNRAAIDGTYDVVIAHAVLHHVENLEHAFDEIARALKPGGTLLVNEYVGPKRFQYSDDIHVMLNALFRALPPYLRRSTLTGQTYEEKLRPTVAEMIRNDPSEAVRADELLPMLGERFDVIERRNLGGTLLQHLLYDVILNFRFEDSVARSLLEMMLAFEAALVDQRRIGSDFVIAAARKKSAPALRERVVALPPLPDEAKAWRPSRTSLPQTLHHLAQLAHEPYRETLNPPAPGNAKYTGDDPHVRAMLDVIERMYTARE